MSARLRNLNPYELHKYLVSVCRASGGRSAGARRGGASAERTDLDVIREHHKFLWEEGHVADTWEQQLAKKYYDKLFKEYCICDLSRFKENKVALRWRIEREVVLGKGQFQCGNKTCNSDRELKSWEVNFAYVEENERKNALVKLRLCPECSVKLNYKSKKREIKRLKKTQKKKKSKRRDSEEANEAEHSPQAPDGSGKPSTSTTTAILENNEDSLWKKGVQETEDKSREEEFEEYLQDLLL